MIAQQKVLVYRLYDQLVAVLKLGIRTDQVMTLAGTYTFPEYRQQRYAQQLVSYAVNLILRQKKDRTFNC